MKHFRMESSELYTASMKVKMSPHCSVLWVFQYLVSEEWANWDILVPVAITPWKKKNSSVITDVNIKGRKPCK